MTPLSIGTAWEDTIAFVKREGTLLFPVAFVFMALPLAILPMLIPPEWDSWQPGSGQPLPPVTPSMSFGFLGMILVTSIGSLALYALALRPGISVAEALQMGFRRLPALIGASLLILAAIMALAVGLGFIYGLFAVLIKPVAPVLGLLCVMGFGVACIYASIRIIMLNPVVLDRGQGPVPSIRMAWRMGHGHFLRLSAFLSVVLVVAGIASSAAQAVFGTIGGVFGGATSALLIGGLASAIVSTCANVYILVMLAYLYRQLESAA